MSRWILTDPVASESYTMVRNPRSMTTVAPPWQTESWPGGGGPRLAFRKGRTPAQWSFQGVSHGEVEYDTLQAWATKPNAIQITDHLGRVHEVVPLVCEPTPRRNRKDQYWRFEYVFKALYVRRVA